MSKRPANMGDQKFLTMFKNPFSFDGRIRRTEYGFSMIIYLVAYLLTLATAYSGMGAFVIVLVVPVVWFLWAQGAKRCHDINKSGWWQLIPFYFLVLLFEDGQPGQNEYGPNPKGIPGAAGQFVPETGTLDGHLKA
jgi:uncharacterized membrane protein YhaH (DUF805 family)